MLFNNKLTVMTSIVLCPSKEFYTVQWLCIAVIDGAVFYLLLENDIYLDNLSKYAVAEMVTCQKIQGNVLAMSNSKS